MSANERKNAGIAFSRVCTERHVPTDVFARVALGLPKKASEVERNDYFLRAIEQVKQDWPFIPMEDYLAQIEETKDWDDLCRHRSVYWQDVPSMLADAIRTRSVQTVRQLALHCLFGNPQLKDEMLALAPDQRTRKALLYPPRVKAEEHYRQYPFCIVENGIVGIHAMSSSWKRNTRIIAMPSNMQKVVFDRLLHREGYTAEQLADSINAERAYQEKIETLYPTMLNHRLFGLGYEIADHGFISKQIPECWLQHEYVKHLNYSDDEVYEMGVSSLTMEVIHQGWKVKFDGVNNCFGHTGYTYLTQWP